jgi:phosphate transport system protein
MSGPLRPGDLPSLRAPQGEVRAAFRDWLDRLDDELVGGALLVAESLPRVSRAFLQADPAVVDEVRALANDVAERGRRVEDHGFVLLAREAPVAGDLRRLVGVLRLVTAVERSAVLLRHVGEAVEEFDARRLPGPVRGSLDELAERAGEVFRHGVDAWRRRDGLAIHDVDRLDEAVDHLQRQVLRRACSAVDAPADVLLLGLLARYFERIADHGVAFARNATFVVAGQRVELAGDRAGSGGR